MATVNEKMTAIADEIRALSGTTGTMGLDAMASNVGDANGVISDQTGLLNQVKAALEGKAGGGVELPVLTNEGTTSDILAGKQFINSQNQVVTGNIPTKTSSDLTVSGATVSVPTGYYASAASKSVATVTQATPSVSVSSSGLITASATQTAGYVVAGTKSGTKQLTVQGAQTITPSTSDKTIASGRYLTGTQTIKGDANLVAENIKSGVSIFGVTGTLEEGSGGSSGESGNYELCTVTIFNDTASGTNGQTGCVYYTLKDGMATLCSNYSPMAVNSSMGSVEDLSQFSVIKGSDLLFYTGGIISAYARNFTITGDIEAIYSSTQAGFTLGCVFKINGNGTITWTK